ncbi:MAG: hypothetical protein H9847_01630, partial [Candidatus Anaerobiospirillum pullicola]|nr:hypothetical protein [Candidatus Anaerobiospirillum pullicola]
AFALELLGVLLLSTQSAIALSAFSRASALLAFGAVLLAFGAVLLRTLFRAVFVSICYNNAL